MQFHLQSVAVGTDCALLRIGGEVDVYTAPQLRERIISLLRDDFRYIITDLHDVSFLDSTGLGALVGSLKRVRQKDGSLALVTGSGTILRILSLTALDRVFTLRSSVEQAISDDQHWLAALAAEGLTGEEWCRKHGVL